MSLKEIVEKRNACSIPWLHTEVNLQTNEIKPCCKYRGVSGSLNEGLETVWNNPGYRQLRDDIANNHTHSACSACAVPDDVFSYKSYKNAIYMPRLHRINIAQPALPEIIHITLKNTCNLACRMCSPYSSSRLNEVTKRNSFLNKFYNFTKVNNRFDLNQLKGSFVNARHLTITGGEPLMDNDCEELIEMVQLESSRLESIVFSTNMTYMNDRLLDRLSAMRIKVRLNISIDGPKHIHEYIRVGCNWDELAENLARLRARYPFEFGINSTISALNIGYIADLISGVEQLGVQTGVKFTHIMATPVLESHLHPGIFAQPELATVCAEYKDRLNSYSASSIQGADTLVKTAGEFLNSPGGDIELFKNFINQFDCVAETDVQSVYPELTGFSL
jgi:sulfatase maturation enzyme AslB (radical SAM superfamily)